MKVSEKSLELNIGAELLMWMRSKGKRKAYLRGLTQREESQEGVDSFLQLPVTTRIFAFQFKAPKKRWEGEPYKFTIQLRQHQLLSQLAAVSLGSVFYVLPYYVSYTKLEKDVPRLLDDTWFLPVDTMQGNNLFGTHKTRTVSCEQGTAYINPNYELLGISELDSGAGVPAHSFAEWCANLHVRRDEPNSGRERKNPWLVRGLRLVIVQPENIL